MKLLVLAVIAGCSKAASPPAPTPPPVVVVADARVDAAQRLVSADRLVVALVSDWSSTNAELRLWKRVGGTWQSEMGPWLGVVGTSGAAWGSGLHGNGAPAGRAGPVKHEGDGKSPAGVFALRGSFGYATTAESALPYQPVTVDWKCVDDPRSKHYNAILDKRTTTVDWKSAEEMRRADDLYKWGVEVAHNPSATPGGGSCIFLHVWRGPDSATVGCTAMEEQMLERLIARIDTSTMFVLLPRAEYAALAEAWGLP
jgi:zinc D-Ala-D-Ala dipeptidase